MHNVGLSFVVPNLNFMLALFPNTIIVALLNTFPTTSTKLLTSAMSFPKGFLHFSNFPTTNKSLKPCNSFSSQNCTHEPFSSLGWTLYMTYPRSSVPITCPVEKFPFEQTVNWVVALFYLIFWSIYHSIKQESIRCLQQWIRSLWTKYTVPFHTMLTSMCLQIVLSVSWVRIFGWGGNHQTSAFEFFCLLRKSVEIHCA